VGFVAFEHAEVGRRQRGRATYFTAPDAALVSGAPIIGASDAALAAPVDDGVRVGKSPDPEEVVARAAGNCHEGELAQQF
jgi:hypothetical protein